MGAPTQGSRDLLCPQCLSPARAVYSGMVQLCSKTHMNTHCYPSKRGAFCISLLPGLKLEFGNWSAQLEKVPPGLCWSSPSGGSQKSCTTSLQATIRYLSLQASSPGTKPTIPRLNTHIRAEHLSCSSDKCFLLLRHTDNTTEGRQGAVKAEEMQTSAASPKLSLG